MEKVDYKQLSNEIYELINQVRQEPKSLLQDLEKMKQYFKDKEYRDPKLNYYLMTQEGVTAVNDAINFLQEKISKKEKLERLEELDKSAQDLVDHIGPDGYTQSQTQSMQIDQRVKQYLKEHGSLSENISFGWKTAKDIVLSMIIDDGVKNRGHRMNLFNSNYKKIGVASGKHKVYEHCTVMDFFGIPEQTNLKFEDYQIDKNEWPENAVSLQKHIESKTSNNKKTVYLTYTFTLSDGQKIVKEKTFEKDI